MSLFTARVQGVSTGTSALTLIQLVPASNATVRVVEVGISFTSVTATDPPVLVDLLRQTSAGTASSLTVVADREDDSKGAQLSARQSFSAEPTASSILRSWEVTPIGGLFVVQFPLGREIDALANRLGLRVTASVSQSATAYLTIDE